MNFKCTIDPNIITTIPHSMDVMTSTQGLQVQHWRFDGAHTTHYMTMLDGTILCMATSRRKAIMMLGADHGICFGDDV